MHKRGYSDDIDQVVLTVIASGDWAMGIDSACTFSPFAKPTSVQCVVGFRVSYQRLEKTLNLLRRNWNLRPTSNDRQ